MSSLIPHDYRYKISSPTPVDKEPKSFNHLNNTPFYNHYYKKMTNRMVSHFHLKCYYSID